MSKWFHVLLCPVVLTWSAMADVWSFLASRGPWNAQFSATKPSVCFTNEKMLKIPTTGFVNNFRLLRTIQAVIVLKRKERLDAASLLKTYFKGPLPTLMQRGTLFLFWNRASVNGALWLVNTFARLSCQKSKSAADDTKNGCVADYGRVVVVCFLITWLHPYIYIYVYFNSPEYT